MIHRHVLVLLCCAIICITSPAGLAASQQGESIRWVATWAEAVKIAKAEKRPIMIHFNMDGEPACEGIARTHFKDEDVVRLSRKFVCVVASPGEHAEETIRRDDEHPELCGRFGSVTCAQHRVSEAKARGEVLQSPTVTAPQFVFVNPELEILVRRPWDLPVTELRKLMNRALYYYNPELAEADPDAEPVSGGDGDGNGGANGGAGPTVQSRRAELLRDLLERAASDNAVKRKAAIDVLARRDDPEIIAFFLKQTSGRVDEVKRNEAVQAIGDAGNANCLPTLIGLLRDRSTQLRRNAIIALRKLGMVEASPALIKAFGVENSTRGKAVILRTLADVDPHGKDFHRLLWKCLKSPKPMIRQHAARACLEADIDGKEFKQLVSLAKGDTDKAVRAVACHAATQIALWAQPLTNPDDKEGEGGDGAAAASRLSHSDQILKGFKKLVGALRKVSAKDRDESLRAYAAVCLDALSATGVDFHSGLDSFHDDYAIFRDY